MNPVRRRDRKRQSSKREQLERAGNHHCDLETDSQPRPLDAGDRHEPLSKGNRHCTRRVVGLAHKQEKDERKEACDPDGP